MRAHMHIHGCVCLGLEEGLALHAGAHAHGLYALGACAWGTCVRLTCWSEDGGGEVWVRQC